MTVLHIGALLERPPGPKYLERLAFAEIAPPVPLPKVATLARWRESLPSGFVCALVAPGAVLASERGLLRLDDELREGIDWLRRAVEAVGARAVVVPTGSHLTTGQRDRDVLAAYIDELGLVGTECEVVWAPDGLWEPEDAIPFARKLGLRYAFDPLEADVLPDEELLYARLRAIGGRQRFSEGMLLDVFERLLETGAEEIFIAMQSSRSFREATKLVELATSVVEAAEEPSS